MRARIVLAAALTGGLVLAAPLSASAHVHLEPQQAAAGSATDLAFAVPNESDGADTTAVRIEVPAALGAVEARAVRGWTARRTAGTGGGAILEWTATGTGIGEDATQDFVVHVDRVPAVGSVPIPVVQTYSDGTVVRWDERTPASGDEPEHPAPTLYVQDQPPPDHDEDAVDAAPASTASSDALPLGLAAAALVVALGALVVAVLALLRRR